MTPASIWCVRANVVESRPCGPGGLEMRSGTKHFRGGAKVWVIDAFPGSAQTVIVIGHHRASGRLVTMALQAHVLRDFRAAVLYSPGVLRRISHHYGKARYPTDETAARCLAEAYQSWALRRPAKLGQRYRVVRLDHEQVSLEALDAVEGQQSTSNIPIRLVPEELRALGSVIALSCDPRGVVRFSAA